jgi:hypothetical protein
MMIQGPPGTIIGGNENPGYFSNGNWLSRRVRVDRE